jgi:putative FmdB family regulatory protein
MPLYEYRCRDCGDRFEVLQRLGEGAEGLSCPDCGAATLDKQFSSFATTSSSSSSAMAEAGCGAAECGTGACCGGGACGMESFN